MRLLALIISVALFASSDSSDEATPWTGRWFPDHTTLPTLNKSASRSMGIVDSNCDDAKTRLEVDWLDNPENYTCVESTLNFTPNDNIRPLYTIENIPKAYKAAHACMNETITYDEIIPTFGTHRPLWPQWGEYTFLPKQRWLHNMEHGGLVMLYHPCANKLEVKQLKALVKGCLYRYVITPYNLLSPIRPLALVAWGRKFEMSVVSKKLVVNFIKESALRGPEHTAKDGQYTHGLIKHAEIVTNESDDNLCPHD